MLPADELPVLSRGMLLADEIHVLSPVLTTADEHIALPHGMLSGSDLEIFSHANYHRRAHSLISSTGRNPSGFCPLPKWGTGG
jgi:hypothetical protein